MGPMGSGARDVEGYKVCRGGALGALWGQGECLGDPMGPSFWFAPILLDFLSLKMKCVHMV